MYMEGGVKKNLFLKTWPFLAHPAGGQETTFYLRVALVTCDTRYRRIVTWDMDISYIRQGDMSVP